MANFKQKTLEQSKKPIHQSFVGMMNDDIGATDPKTILIRWLKEFFGNDVVFSEQLPIADSFVTNQELSVMVMEVDDNTIETGCKGIFSNMVVDVVIYQRKECQVAGDLELIDKYLNVELQALIGAYNLISIQGIHRDDAKPERFIEENFRGRRITYIIDYAYNKG